MTINTNSRIRGHNLTTIKIAHRHSVSLEVHRSVLLPYIPTLLSPHELSGILWDYYVGLRGPGLVYEGVHHRSLLGLSSNNLLLTSKGLMTTRISLSQVARQYGLRSLRQDTLSRPRIRGITTGHALAIGLSSNKTLTRLGIARHLRPLIPFQFL